MKPLKSQNFYEILGIPRHSSQEDIRRAFEICKQTYGSDSLATYSLFSDEENQEIFSLIAQAYETLCNPNTRREYDVYLSHLDGDGERHAAETERMVASMIGLGAGPPEAMSRREAIAAAGGNHGSRPARDKAKPDEEEPEKQPNGEEQRHEKFVQSVSQFNGPVLKKIRGMKGISIEQLADQTKIRITYLKYLEEENFEFLPAAVYVKGFVTNIASALGLPPQRVAEDYMEVYRAKMHKG